MSNGLANFVIGAGTGYLGAETQKRDRARQDTRDAQDKEMFDARLRNENARFEDGQLERRDRNALRTAARPIVPEESGSGGMVRPPEMDNRDVGLPENAAQPNMGLSAARYKVAGKDYGSRSEADAAAAPMNTPEASAKRYATAQTGLGDFKGAQQTMAELEKAKREQRSAAADAMMRDIGTGFISGGWAGGTKVLSESTGDGNDYRHEVDPKTGKVNILQVNRKDGQGRVIGSFDDNDLGKIDAYKVIGAAITRQPEIAALHQEGKRKQSLEERRLDQGDRKLSQGDRNLENAEQRTEYYGDWTNRPQAVRGGGGSTTDGTSREERLRYTSLFNESGRRMAEAQKALTSLQKDVMYSMAKPGSPQHEEIQTLRKTITDLGDERKQYQSMLAGSQTTAPSQPGLASARPNAPAGQAARDSDRMSILQSELDKAKQSGNTGDVAALEREIGRGGGKPAAAPTPKPAAPKPGAVQGGYRFKGGNPADKANWERE